MRSLRGQLASFALVGAVGVAAYLLLYALLREALPAHAANITSRVVVAVPTTWVNGRRTFGTSVSRRRLYLGALAVLAVSIVITSVPLAAEQALLGPDRRGAELVTLAGATVLATAARFVLMRQWLFRHPSPLVTTPPRPAVT